MMVDASPRPSSSGRPSDTGLYQNLTRLDIASANAPPEGRYQSTQAIAPPQPGYFSAQPVAGTPQYSQPASAAEQPSTPRRNKRQAWYGGPVGPAQPGRPSPEDSGSSDGVPTPLNQQGVEYHPVIVNANEPYPPHTSMAPQEQKVYYASLPTASLTPPQQQTQSKPEPQRTDSGFQSYIPTPQHMQAARQHTYALQAGHDPRSVSGYMQAPNQHNNDMGRLEALVAVATSENRVVKNQP
jgi:hypothetical protein